MNTQPTPLQQRLSVLPQDRYVDFRARTEGSSGVWYAYWNEGGAIEKRWLGEDEDGAIAQERQRRLNARIQRLPVARPEQTRRTCEHSRPVVWCDACRARMIAEGLVRVVSGRAR